MGADRPVIALIGQDDLVYIRRMLSDDVERLYPDAPKMEPGLHLFALLGADGQPILLTDSQEVALASAIAHDYKTVSLH